MVWHQSSPARQLSGDLYIVFLIQELKTYQHSAPSLQDHCHLRAPFLLMEFLVVTKDTFRCIFSNQVSEIVVISFLVSFCVYIFIPTSIILWVHILCIPCVYILLQAGEGQLGTDESVFNQILCTRNYNQLRQTFYFYHTDHEEHILDVIKRECTGTLELAYCTIGKMSFCHQYSCTFNRLVQVKWALMNLYLTKSCVQGTTTSYEPRLDTMRMILRLTYLTILKASAQAHWNWRTLPLVYYT